MILKVFVAESGSLVRLRCDLPKDFWQHSSPSNDIIWKKKSPKDLIFHNNDSNGNSKAPKWKTAPYNNAASSASSAAGQDIKQQQKQSLAPFSTSTADSSKLKPLLLKTFDETTGRQQYITLSIDQAFFLQRISLHFIIPNCLDSFST